MRIVGSVIGNFGASFEPVTCIMPSLYYSKSFDFISISSISEIVQIKNSPNLICCSFNKSLH